MRDHANPKTLGGVSNFGECIFISSGTLRPSHAASAVEPTRPIDRTTQPDEHQPKNKSPLVGLVNLLSPHNAVMQ